MTADEISAAVAERFPDAGRTVELGQLTVDVPPERWLEALRFAREQCQCRFFDWLAAVADPGEGPADQPAPAYAVVAHLWSVTGRHHLFVRTRVAGSRPRLASATGLFPGAAWHERETWEMFGIAFSGHPDLRPLLLPPGFSGHPLRKDFALVARTAKPWPGAQDNEPRPDEEDG